jgi:ribose transport system ATP-binding protein
MADGAHLLRLTGVRKRFAGSVALDDVNFDLRQGEVHVLFGENGASKSTLINVITGNVSPDAGKYQLADADVSRMTPRLARASGISSVFQEFSLVPDLTVAENLFLGREPNRAAFVNARIMRRTAAEFLARLRFEVPVDALVGRLSRAERQMVEIAKALMDPKARIAIFDEPTASLTDTDSEKLFAIIADLKARGVGVIYVSHRMREIRRLADRITVLRGGRLVATVLADGVTEGQLVELMVGRPIGDLYPMIRHRPAEVRLAVERLSSKDRRVRDVSLNVRGGEVVGLAGLVGCGKGEVGRLVFGLDVIAGGRVTIDGKAVVRPAPREMLRAGVCYFPADRGRDGLALNRPVRENASAAALDLRTIGGGGLLRLGEEARRVQSVLQRLSVRPLTPERPVVQFSGGNRQKVMLARGLMRDIRVFLFDEPSVGIDIGAKAEIYALVRDLTEAGAAVLLASSELTEVLYLANRIYVMHEGVIVDELTGENKTEAAILSCFFGRKQSASAAGAETAA